MGKLPRGILSEPPRGAGWVTLTGGAVQSQLERLGSGLVTPESQHGDKAHTRQGTNAFRSTRIKLRL